MKRGVCSIRCRSEALPSRCASARVVAARGFTIVEVLAVIAILAILSAIGYSLISTDRSKATALTIKTNEVAKGLIRFKQDVSCYPTNLSGLDTSANAANTRCGINGTPAWRGPYIQRGTFTATGMSMGDLIPGAEVTLAGTANATRGTTEWTLVVTGVPNELLNKVLEACNGGAQQTGRCTTTPGTAVPTGSFAMLFDETT